ncbi:hypothetical protein [Dactylosporangium salmoneum]|uniref:PLD phosphodiesterase domain-containing protein n=1 Tax=Dactylosporangium salmoneum TaxID=53361 RepID=A0ABN3FK80_9ACTN
MSDAIPHRVLTDAVQAAVDGRRVVAAVFCTFRFEPGFFEQEVLPVLFDRTLHHNSHIRRLQLEDALRPLSGKVAVYYDPRALVEGDRGPAVLDVRRIPVLPSTGFFHPKLVLVLIEDAQGRRELVVVTGSANLTQAGWWHNVECVHVECLRAEEPAALRDGLMGLLGHVSALAEHFKPHTPLDEIRDFLAALPRESRRRFLANGRVGGRSLPQLFEDAAGADLHGLDLEIISPYLDAPAPLEQLLSRFQPNRWRILLPEDRDTAVCPEQLFDWVRQHGGTWGRLPGAVTAGGDPKARQRTVHAKTYRFFGPDREFVFVGSFNLTRPAHQAAGNVESGVLVDGPAGRRRRRFWLEEVTERPVFARAAGEDEDGGYDLIPLAVRYDWAEHRAEVLWGGDGPSPILRAEEGGLPVFEVRDLPPETWTPLPAEATDALAARLRQSSMLTVHDGPRCGIVLVLETGMAHRPSVLVDLTAAEILRYWSLLSPEQRDAVIAEHGRALIDHTDAPVPAEPGGADTIFDRFAGVFHGFAALARSVTEALSEGRDEEARYRMFGAKYDSLPVLVERVARDEAGDPVDRYLMVLCARQVADRIRRDWPDFWAGDPAGTTRLETALTVQDALRRGIVDSNGPDMDGFLNWYEAHFLHESAEQPA